jgi:integrase
VAHARFPLRRAAGRAGNFASVPYADVPAFVASLNEQNDTAGRLALLFTILTATRSGEVRSARWSQIDLDAKEWRRPTEQMKSGEAHVVTLSPAALAVLKRAHVLRTTLADALAGR